MDATILTSAWGLSGTAQLSPLAHGTNNEMWRVETPDGAYVLRVYSNHSDLARLRFEHDVLLKVQAAGLPFAVPAPISTQAGEYYARIDTHNGITGGALATLAPLIPGALPRRDDLVQAEAAGRALGLLDAALARISPADPDAAVSWRGYGDLERCHPLVPDPRAAIAELPIATDHQARLLARYGWLLARLPDLYAALPRQLAHEDCSPSNFLLRGAHVTGVLDFEFCSRDLRVMDLAVALSWWPVGVFGSGAEWPIIAALARGYFQHIALTPPEIDAIPVLFQLRAYTSLIHRLGRFRQRLCPVADVVERAEAAIAREDWLAANGQRLSAAVRGALE